MTFQLSRKAPRFLFGLGALLAGCLAASGCHRPQPSEPPSGEIKPSYDLQALRSERERLAHRKRRIIYNNDGGDLRDAKDRNVSREAFLRARTTGIENTQIDSIFYCTSRGWGVFSHDTTAGASEASAPESEEGAKLALYLAAGLDPLAMMVDFARAHQMEIFWSFRVNDTHDGDTQSYSASMFATNRLKNEHPEYLLGSREAPPKFPKSWSSVNYALPAVQEQTLEFFTEIFRRYDVDGVELDFLRHQVFFKSTANREIASPEEREAMTRFMRQLRQASEDEGLRRGKPFLISIRVPDSIDYCKGIGLDLEEWLREGLVDLLVVTGYVRLNPWEESVALGHRHGVPVYASLDEPRIKPEENRRLRNNIIADRGRALLAWNAGVDGIYVFNRFLPKTPRWKELGDPEVLARLDKDYFASIRGASWAVGLPHESYIRIPVLNPARPFSIPPGQEESVGLQVGDDPAGPAGTRLRLEFGERFDESLVTVKLNRKPIELSKKDGEWLVYDLPISRYKKGENLVTVRVSGSATQPVIWKDLHLQIRYP